MKHSESGSWLFMLCSSWKEKASELFGIDLRSLALFRIGLGALLLGDLLNRANNLEAHYTDKGVLPRSLLSEVVADHRWGASFHELGGTWEVQLFFFLLAAVFAIALMVGYRTRAATVLSWIFLLSLQARNPLVLQGGDIVLRVLLFWALFLPLGGIWSLDRRLEGKWSRPLQLFSAGTLGLLLQVCFIYWFSALLKSDPVWTKDGTAVWYALSNEFFSKPFGIYLLNYPGFLKVLSFATYYLEKFGPLLAFSPVWTGPLRFGIAAIFILFHLVGLNLTLELGIFPYVCSVAWTVFIPAWFWDKIFRRAEVRESFWKASFESNALAAFFIAYIFLWNVQTLNIRIPGFPYGLGSILGVSQTWNMFAPYPLKDDGWFVVPAILNDGEKVDLYSGGPLDWAKPRLVSGTFKDDRWRSYMMGLFLKENQAELSGYAAYLSRNWDLAHPPGEHVKELEIVLMTKINDIDHPDRLPKREVLWPQQ